LHKKEDHFYRFNIDATAHKVVKFEVRERVSANEQHRLRDITELQVNEWFNENYLDNTTFEKMMKMVRINEERILLRTEKQQALNFCNQVNSDKVRAETILRTFGNLDTALERQDKRLEDDQKKEIDGLLSQKNKRAIEDQDTIDRQKKEEETTAAKINEAKGDKKKLQTAEEDKKKRDQTEKARLVHQKTDREEEEKQRTKREENYAKKRKDIGRFKEDITKKRMHMNRQLAQWAIELSDVSKKNEKADERLNENQSTGDLQVSLLMKVPSLIAPIVKEAQTELPARIATDDLKTE